MKYYLICWCLFFGQSLKGSTLTDSLIGAIAHLETTQQAAIYNQTAQALRKQFPDSAIYYAESGLVIAAQHQQTNQQLTAYNILGLAHKQLGHHEIAKQYFLDGYAISLEQQDVKHQASLTGNLGNLLFDMGELEPSLEYHTLSLKAEEQLDNQEGIIASYITIGVVYVELNNMEKAFQYFEDAKTVAEKIEHHYYAQFCHNNIGMLYMNQKDFNKALPYFERSLELSETLGLKSNIAASYNSIGACYQEMNDIGQSLKHLKKALAIREELQDERGMAITHGNIGEAYFMVKNYALAFTNYQQGLELTQKSKVKPMIRDFNKMLADRYAELKQFDQAYTYYAVYANLKDSILNEETMRQVSEFEAKYENEKKQKEIELLNKDKALQVVEIARKDTQRNLLGVSIFALVLIAGFIFYGYFQKRKDNQILGAQKKEIEGQNKAITDSIRYAKRLQQAILPSSKLISQHIPEHFILFRPKDIVSGDFYWMEEKNGKIYLAVVDCTGHGVPGAMVSMVGNNGLNRYVLGSDLKHPAEILDHLSDYVEDTFRMEISQYDNSIHEKVKDGMDISLCMLDYNTKTIEFSGAYNSLLCISDGELTEIKADRQPVGAYQNRQPFTNHVHSLKSGAMYYLLTDGYLDQFGGPRNKKFTKRRFKELLLDIYDKPAAEQQQRLANALDEWQGETQQVDDISVMGIRVG